MARPTHDQAWPEDIRSIMQRLGAITRDERIRMTHCFNAASENMNLCWLNSLIGSIFFQTGITVNRTILYRKVVEYMITACISNSDDGFIRQVIGQRVISERLDINLVLRYITNLQSHQQGSSEDQILFLKVLASFDDRFNSFSVTTYSMTRTVVNIQTMHTDTNDVGVNDNVNDMRTTSEDDMHFCIRLLFSGNHFWFILTNDDLKFLDYSHCVNNAQRQMATCFQHCILQTETITYYHMSLRAARLFGQFQFNESELSENTRSFFSRMQNPQFEPENVIDLTRNEGDILQEQRPIPPPLSSYPLNENPVNQNTVFNDECNDERFNDILRSDESIMELCRTIAFNEIRRMRFAQQLRDIENQIVTDRSNLRNIISEREQSILSDFPTCPVCQEPIYRETSISCGSNGTTGNHALHLRCYNTMCDHHNIVLCPVCRQTM